MIWAALTLHAAADAVNSTVGILGWLIIGGLAGALAGRVVERKGLGLIPDVITRIVGALVAGFISRHFMNATLGLTGSFIIAFLLCDTAPRSLVLDGVPSPPPR